MSKSTIIAVAGKGGVGKTSLSATIVRCLTEKYPDKKILAIDADPAVGLSTALGIDVKMTIDDIRKEIIASVDEGDTRGAVELLGEAKYRIFDALVETDGYSFIAVGRPESAGCYCKINSYLKEVISILSDEFDYVVIDGEAGIEQINRRVMERVTHLILITDPSKKGCQVIKTIKGVADDLDNVGRNILPVLSGHSGCQVVNQRSTTNNIGQFVFCNSREVCRHHHNDITPFKIRKNILQTTLRGSHPVSRMAIIYHTFQKDSSTFLKKM